MVNSLIQIAIAFGIFILAVVANIVVSTYYNTRQLKQSFDVKRLLDGVLKMITLGFGSVILSVVVMLVGQYLPEYLSDVLSLSAILATFGAAIVKYFTEAYSTFQDIMTNHNIIDDTKGLSKKSEETNEVSVNE